MSQSEKENELDEYGPSITGGDVWKIGSTAAGGAAWIPEEGIVHPELPRITCEQLKQLIDEGNSLVIVNAGMESSFRSGRIKGSINIPAAPLPPLTEAFVTARLARLPSNRLIVFYCDWEDDSDSASLALKLIESGFDADKVKVLSKGWGRWLELDYPVEE